MSKASSLDPLTAAPRADDDDARGTAREESGRAGWRKAGALHVEARLEALGFRHGTTTRSLGNMKDSAARVAAIRAAGLSAAPLILSQVHGTGVVETAAVAGVPAPRADGNEARGTAREEAGGAPAPRADGSEARGTAREENGRADPRPQADGWVTAERGAVPAVYVADCLPIFVWDPEGTAAGVFHAGWRGLAAGMPRAAVRAFRRFGLGPERLEAAVGPHIGACCYSVGPEVASKFRAEVLRDGKLDLGAEAALQLAGSGIAPERVSVSPACTSCSADEFFSYRREKLDQRMLAFIALPEPSHGT